MTEFSLIDRYCSGIGKEQSGTRIGVGDDAAVIAVPSGMELAVSVDTMVEGTHFFPNADPRHLAHKLLAVNLSDMAAMGATPKWATLSLTMPETNHTWLAAFSASLDQLARRFNVQLIGGDTTSGALCLSLQIMGLLPAGSALTRAGALLGDDVYVSNTVGDAALALHCLQADAKRASALASLPKESLMPALHCPEPQLALGQGLLNIASACLDVSDGLIADLSHIAEQSKVSIEVDVDKVPLSSTYREYCALGGSLDLALSGGDDYQLVFTAHPDSRDELVQLAKLLGVTLTKIGHVVAQTNVPVTVLQGREVFHLKQSGYQHFQVDSD